MLRPVNLTFRIFIQVDWDKDPLIYIVLALGKLEPGNDCERTLIHYKSSMYLQTKTIYRSGDLWEDLHLNTDFS